MPYKYTLTYHSASGEKCVRAVKIHYTDVIYLSTCVHTYSHEYLRTFMKIWIFIYIYIHIYIYIYICMYEWTPY